MNYVNKLCTGCSACNSICPQKAISMSHNEKGFLCAQIDLSKCNNCGLCRKTCPLNNEKNQNHIKLFSGWSNKEEVLKNSSSGGIFSEIATMILDKKGVVFGATISNNKVEHIMITNQNELSKLRKSKYAQSDLGNSFTEIEKLLKKDIITLFSGTPCQVAGLKKFLGKEYTNLYTVDIICHGVPSHKILDEYLEELKFINDSEIVEIDFRSKEKGWTYPSFKLKFNNNKNNKESFYVGDTYMRAFGTNMILNDSCYSCKFNDFRNYSDITLGDYWGIDRSNLNIYNENGVSLIIINNEKGQDILDKISSKLNLNEDVNVRYAANNNYPLILSSDKHVNTNAFWKMYNKKEHNSIIELLDKVQEDLQTKPINKNVGILNFHYENYNFGANLVTYSMYKVISKLGYNPTVINFDPFPLIEPLEKYKVNGFSKFREKELSFTSRISNKNELYSLNKLFDIFVTGSDQVWRKSITKDNFSAYFLDFVFDHKVCFSYSASFGEQNLEFSQTEIGEIATDLKKFRGVSVREKSGIKICKDIFNVDSIQVLDPTLLLDENEYIKLIDEEKCEINKDYIAAYFICEENNGIPNERYIKKIIGDKKLVNIKGKLVKSIIGTNFVYSSIPSWVSLIKNCDCLITDSYHGVLFSIIFKKPFIYIPKNEISSIRCKEIFDTLGISGRILKSIKEIKSINELKNTDYKKVHKILENEKSKSISYLTKMLSSRVDDKINIDNIYCELFKKNYDLNEETIIKSKEIDNYKKIIIQKEIELSNVYNSKRWRIINKIANFKEKIFK